MICHTWEDEPLSSSQKVCNTGFKVLGEWVLSTIRHIKTEALCQVHESPAARSRHLGVVIQSREKSGEQCWEVNSWVDSLTSTFADSAKRIGSGILDHDNRVTHHSDEDWEGLLNQWLQNLKLGTFHDSTES